MALNFCTKQGSMNKFFKFFFFLGVSENLSQSVIMADNGIVVLQKCFVVAPPCGAKFYLLVYVG